MTEPPFIKPPNILFNYNTNNTTFLTLVTLFIIIPMSIFIYLFSKDFRIILEKLLDALYLTSADKRKALFDCFKQNIGILIGPILLWMILSYASTDPNVLFSNISSYVLVILAVVIGCFAFFSSLLSFSNTPPISVLMGGIALICIPMIVYFSSYINPGIINYVGNALKLLILLIIIIGLAIGYKVFAERIKAFTGWKGFIANFLFYIPCLLSDGLEYLLQQYNITPNVVFVLFILEIILVLGYVYIPKLISKSVKKTSIMLQNKPVYLNKELQIGDTQQFLYKPLGDKHTLYATDDIPKYRTNYCISMWVFINIQPSNAAAYANETTVFDYSSHPRITYKNQTKNSRQKNRDVYTFYFSNTNNNANYEVSIPNQKWNFISLNYFESKVDLYINGNLERTFNFSDNMPEYASSDLVKLGSDNGLSGAICNVTYNKKPLSAEEIAMMYNINYLKNPPVDIFE